MSENKDYSKIFNDVVDKIKVGVMMPKGAQIVSAFGHVAALYSASALVLLRVRL